MLLLGCLTLNATLAFSQDTPAVDLSGVWSTNSLDTLNHPGWGIEGQFSCRCAAETYEYLQTLLYDSSNDHMSALEIIDALSAHTLDVVTNRLTEAGQELGSSFDLSDDPAITCERFGTIRTILHADPIEFEVLEDRVLIRGEDLTVDRTVYTDGRGHPEAGEKTAAGHSIGWYEDRAFVVETVDVAANFADDQLTFHNSDQVRSVERYTVSPDRQRLESSVTIYDAVMLSEPLTIVRPRVSTPNIELDRAPCESISGQF